jgi:uncharacterized protein YbbK (DUF523 family)
VPCRYDGKSKPSLTILASKEIIPIPVCPEQLGGCPTPRPRAWFEGGDGRDVLKGTARVVNGQGEDVTEAFVSGARSTLHIAVTLGVAYAVLKEGSPSCGINSVTIEGVKEAGMGVTAALLVENGITVTAEDGDA